MRRTTRALAATIAAVATLATGAASAQAVEATRSPYVDVTLESVQDGTGHGTPAQTFVNSKNGFKIGDDSPTDGVVSSGDTVTYVERLSFQPAQRRVVTVGFDLSGASLLEDSASLAQCPDGHDVKVSKTTSGCRYEVPAGVAENLTATLRLIAKDSGGVPVDNQKPMLTVSRDGGATEKHALPAETVVSTPNADFYLDNGAYDGKERVITGHGSGYFELKVRPKGWKDYSTTHGASASGVYSGTVDVSQFPDGTEWTLDGEKVNVENGRIRLRTLTGDHRLQYSTISSKDGEQSTYDIHVDLDADSFKSTGDPGSGEDKTYDVEKRTDGLSDTGKPYPNNNWSRVVVGVESATVGGYDVMSMITGTDGRYTIFDPENMDMTAATNEQDGIVTTSTSAKVRVVDRFVSSSIPTHEADWSDGGLTYQGGLKVYDAQGAETDDYVLQYGHDCRNMTCGTWNETLGDDTHSIRVLRRSIDLSRIEFDMRASDEVGYTQVGVQPGNGVKRLAPGLWTLETSHTGSDKKLGPTDRTNIEFNATMRNLQTTHAPLSVTADVCLPQGLTRLTPSGSGWDIQETTGTETCAKTYRMTLADASYRVSEGTDMRLPSIGISGMVNVDVQSGDYAPSVTYTVHTDAWGKVEARSLTVSDSTPLRVEVEDGHTNRIRRSGEGDSDKWTRKTVDVGGVQSFDWSVYNRGKDMDGNVETILLMPTTSIEGSRNGDKTITGVNNTGPEGHWKEYDRGYSTVSAYLANPVTVEDGNATILYSAESSFDPHTIKDWHTWDELSEADRKKIATVKIVTPVQNNTASATGTVEVRYDGEGDANTWIGASSWVNPNGIRVFLSDTPWPDGVKAAYSHLSGAVFYDYYRDGKEHNSGRYDNTNQGDGYRSIRFSFWKSDQQGDKLEQVETNSNRPYEATHLTSGWYHVEASGFQPDQPDDNDKTIGYKPNYYQRKSKPVATTDTAWTVYLNPGESKTIKLGYYRPDVRLTVEQDVSHDCDDDACTVEYNTTLTGKTIDPVKKEGATLHFRLDGTEDAKVQMVTSEIRFKKIWGSPAGPNPGHAIVFGLDENGHVWARGNMTTKGDSAYGDFSPSWMKIDQLDGENVTSVSAPHDGSDVVASLANGTVRFINGWDFGKGTYPDIVNLNPPDGVKIISVYGAYNGGGSVFLGDDGHLYALSKRSYFSDDERIVRVPDPEGESPFFTRIQGITSDVVIAWTREGEAYVYSSTSPSSVYSDMLNPAYDDGYGTIKEDTLFPLAVPSGGPDKVREIYYLSNGDGMNVSDNEKNLWMYDRKTRKWTKVEGAQVETLAADATAYLNVGVGNDVFYFLGTDKHIWRYMSESGYKSCLANDYNRYHRYGCGGYEPQIGLSQVPSARTFHNFVSVGNSNSHDWGAMALDDNGHLWSIGLDSYDNVFDSGLTDITPTDTTGRYGKRYTQDIQPTKNVVKDGDRWMDVELPYNLAAQSLVTYRVTRTLDRGKADRTTGLQSWFDSPDTPYQGTPVSKTSYSYGYDADKPSTPTRFDLSQLYVRRGYIEGNPTCIVGENSHAFPPEDSCEQTGAIIPARILPGQPVKGSISGIMWEDLNNNGLRDSDAEDDIRLSGQTVTLYKADGTRASKTTTGKDGSYRFDSLPQGEYYLWFGKPAGKWFTTPDKDDPTPESDGSSDDSDASDSMDEYGRSTVTLTIDANHVAYSHVDAGIKHVGWIQGMPDTGRSMLLLVIIPLIMALGCEGWRQIRKQA